ncbi:MAG: hypothetical protein DHS20C15_27100 [Planctomycetota bacterium]|nr:MAG: hypothetical protein DHS20C15_27100 [Planctomycetota bacterium]
MTTLGVGIVGMGFMGTQHAQSYLAAARDGMALRVVALCDPDPARCVLPELDAPKGAANAGALPEPGVDRELGDIDRAPHVFSEARDIDLAPRVFSEPAALFADPRVELVSVCTYTESHVPLAIAALAAGKHVVVEKPVALDPDSVQRLVDAARAHPGQLCMPAMCMRFWPGWDHLAACVADGRHGAVRSARLHRSGPRPDWADAFYGDPARSGGALVDLHIHDADFVRWCFGVPAALSCSGTRDAPSTRYEFLPASAPDARAHPATRAAEAVRAGLSQPLAVSTEAAWLDDPEAAFDMGFEVEFERATLRYRLADDAPSSERRSGDTAFRALPVSSLSGYDGELRHALRCVEALRRDPAALDSAALLHEAADLARMLRVEAESLSSGGDTCSLD